MSAFPFAGVEGLLSDRDKEQLARLSSQCADLEGDYVEIGSLYGLSALWILSGMPSGKKLWAYDLFEEGKKRKFIANLGAAINRVEMVTGSFRDRKQSPKAVAFAFVDHNHTYGDTIAAFEFLWPLLHWNGLLAVHDYGHPDYPGGTKAIDEFPRTTEYCVFVPPIEGSSIAVLCKRDF